ncbi:hypothetical protein KAW11_01420 [Candidatus Bathyarchaeota archaeon]|nr:hypothetical protein [Candidatus Bathyarchaeota archaeon]
MRMRPLVLVIVFSVIVSAGFLMMPRSTGPSGNPNEEMWLEEAHRIWLEKGFLNQTVEELMITSTACQIETFGGLFDRLAISLVTPLWGFGTLIAGSIVAFVVSRLWPEHRRPKK